MAEIPVGTLEELLNNPEVRAQAEKAGQSVRDFIASNEELSSLVGKARAPASDASAPGATPPEAGADTSGPAPGPRAPTDPPDAGTVQSAVAAKRGAGASGSWGTPAKAAAGGAALGAGAVLASQPGAMAGGPTGTPAAAAPDDDDADEEAAPPAPAPKAPPAAKPAAGAPVPGKVPTTGAAAPIKPDTAASITEGFETRLKNANEAVRTKFEPALSKLDALQDAYRVEYQKAADKTALAELGEKMGHAFAQLGAGIQGMKTGVDMSSGLKFDKTDWSKRYELLLNKMRDDLVDVRAQRGQILTEQEKQEAGNTAIAGRGIAAGVRDIDVKERTSAAEREQKSRQASAATEGALNRASHEKIAGMQSDARVNAATGKAGNKAEEELGSGLSMAQQAWDMQDDSDKGTRQKGVALEAQAMKLLGKHMGTNAIAEAKAARKEPAFLAHPIDWLQSDAADRNAAAMGKLNAGAAQKTPSPPASGMVTVTALSDGQPYRLPKAAADKAVKDGKAKY